MPEPGLSQEPVRPAKPSVTAYMALSRSLLKPKRSRYLATGCWHRLMKVCRHRQQGRTVGRVQVQPGPAEAAAGIPQARYSQAPSYLQG